MTRFLLTLVLGAGLISSAYAQRQKLSDDEVRQRIIQESIASYPGGIVTLITATVHSSLSRRIVMLLRLRSSTERTLRLGKCGAFDGRSDGVGC